MLRSCTDCYAVHAPSLYVPVQVICAPLCILVCVYTLMTLSSSQNTKCTLSYYCIAVLYSHRRWCRSCSTCCSLTRRRQWRRARRRPPVSRSTGECSPCTRARAAARRTRTMPMSRCTVANSSGHSPVSNLTLSIIYSYTEGTFCVI